MPYSEKQCKLFAIREARGQKVPSDWKKHCKKKKVKRGSTKK